jgi:hypothetical protein
MRLREFASAEDQLALLKLIMDHTWAALATQAAAQAQARERTKAAGGRKRKTKPKPSSARAPNAARVTKPIAPPSPPQAAVTAAPNSEKQPRTDHDGTTYPRPLPTNTAATSAEPKPVPWYQRPKALRPAQLL